MENINKEENIIIKELYPLIEYAKWEIYNFNSLKKTNKIIRKELAIIDKDVLKQWKQKSGYNSFKKQIFNYLFTLGKLKNQKEKINEENNKINNMWEKEISDKKIIPNIESFPKKDISGFFLNLKENQIDGYKHYELISSKLFEIFKNFVNYKIITDGFYNKGKLVVPLNFKNKINNNENIFDYLL